MGNHSNIMKFSGTCPKCQNTEIIQDAFAFDQGHRGGELGVATFDSPQALIFTGMHSTSVSAWVCAKCGFIEFHADQPRQLKSNSFESNKEGDIPCLSCGEMIASGATMCPHCNWTYEASRPD